MTKFSPQIVSLASIFLLATTKVYGKEDNRFGVLYATSSESNENGMYCMMYNPKFRTLPPDRQLATKYDLGDLTYTDLCHPPQIPPHLTGDAAAVARGNCTFSDKATLVQKYGGEAALIVSSGGLFIPVANQSHEYDEINISVAVMGQSDFTEIQGFKGKVQVQLFAPLQPWLDYNLILIWTMAMTTLVTGAFWSGLVKQREMLRRRGRGARSSTGAEDAARGDGEEEEEQETLDVSPQVIFIFVVLMCCMLISLYFLYDYLVYVIISLFCVASALALYSCLKPLLIRIPCCKNLRIPPNKLPLLSNQPEVRRILLFLACAAVAVWWGVERNKWYAWILQDILGFVFCVHMMKTARLSSLKICTVLLVLLFLYDIFFVFITPLFTKSGQSVMVDVATGGESSTGEMLPMVLKVPRLSNPLMSVCALPFSLLGFGDIIIPGLLVSYCHGFDLKMNTGRIYFFATVVAYGVGLVLTFVALALMSQGQPALLYLVPCTLLTTFLTALCRGEFKHMWFGDLSGGEKGKQPKGITQTTRTANGSANGPSSPIANGAPPSTTAASTPVDDAVNTSSLESDSEQSLLIQR